MRIQVQAEPFDPGAVLNEVGASDGAGAQVSFTGIVRDDGGLDHMEIEHYPAMTEAAIEKYVTEAIQRWTLLDCVVIHRHGRLRPGEMIMMVITTAPHRVAAFEAAEYLMDYLKSRAPFWKKEVLTSGEARWVDAKADDEDALRRW